MVTAFEIFIIGLIAGVGGTGLGGIVGTFFRKGSNRLISMLLSLTSGIMIAIVCFELLVESVDAAKSVMEDSGVFLTVAAVLAGVGIVMLLNFVIDKITTPQVEHTASADHPLAHDDIDELVHVDHYNEHAKLGAAKRDLWTAGIIIACAIALHNIPEGMSIGATFAIQAENSLANALMLAILIGLHNIPEGMAVSLPLVTGGMSRIKAILLTATSGLPMAIGALIGLWIGDIGAIGLSCSLGFASGAMLYVVFGEIMPQAILMYKSRTPAIALIVGILVGMCLIYL